MVCRRAVPANRSHVRAATTKTPQRRLRSASPPAEPPVVAEARAFHGVDFGDIDRRRYNVHNLGKLFQAVTGNGHIHIARLQNMGPVDSPPIDEALRKFADGLPASNLVCVNLGEYRASPAAWQYLADKIREPGCVLGHIFIEPNTLQSGLTPALKEAVKAAMRPNRRKEGYLQKVRTVATVNRIRAANPWAAPRKVPGT